MLAKIKNDKNIQIKVGGILSYVSIFINILAGLIYTPWMIQEIGPSQYGLFTLANSLISLFLIDFGLSSATARYVSLYRAEGNQEKVDRFLGAIYKLYLLVDTIIFICLIILFFLIDSIYVKLTPIELEQLKVVYCIAGLYSIISFPFVTLNGILTAYEQFIQQKLADIIYRVLVVVLKVIILLQGGGLYALVIVNAIAGLTSIFYKIFIIKRNTEVKPKFDKTETGLYKKIFEFSIWVTVASLAQRLVFNITPSILGMVANTTAIAIFGIITTIESYTFTLTNAINGMFIPKVSRIYTRHNDNDSIMRLMLNVGRFQYALNGLIVVGFAVLGKEFIVLWMGESYIEAYYGILLVIIPGMFYNALEIAHTAITVQNKVRIQAFVNIGMGICNVILSLVLSKIYGVIGACISIFIAYSLRAIILHIIYNKILDIDIIMFAKKCYLKLMPVMIISLVFGKLILSVNSIEGWGGILCNGIIVVAIYGFLIFMFGITKEEKNAILLTLKNKIRSSKEM